MVALHFYGAVFHCSTRAATGLELLTQRDESHRVQLHTAHHGNPFTRPAFGVEPDPYYTVTRWWTRGFATLAQCYGFAACGAHTPSIGGIDQATLG